jgi:hypothetical protein
VSSGQPGIYRETLSQKTKKKKKKKKKKSREQAKATPVRRMDE